jgi:hypothetical protein
LNNLSSAVFTVNDLINYFFLLGFFAVFADTLKSFADGAAFDPTRFIFSPDPASMRFFFALMLAYNPGFIFYVRLNLTAFDLTDFLPSHPHACRLRSLAHGGFLHFFIPADLAQ